MHVAKYTGDTNPGVWLEDYRLACWAEGAEDEYFIIQYLPLYLVDSPQAWLEYCRMVGSRSDHLKDVFIGNFQDIYT